MSFLKRNLAFIIGVTFLTTFTSVYFILYKITPSFHTTIFTSITNQSASSSEENEQASTYFGETIMGWFRNPVFLNKIFEQAGVSGNISSHKQERQNLIIEIDSNTAIEGKKLAETILIVLESDIISYNKKSNSQYNLLNLGISSYSKPLKHTLIILAGIISSFLLTILLILIIESIQGILSLPSQVQQYFNSKQIIFINPNNSDDIDFLAVNSLQSNIPVLLAGADFDSSDITVKTAIRVSEIQENMVLIDGDLKEKKLHKNLGLSDLMKNLKGLTNRLKKQETLAKFVYKAVDKKLNFLPAGSGDSIILENLADQLSAHKSILIHTNLPQNFPMLSLEK